MHRNKTGGMFQKINFHFLLVLFFIVKILEIEPSLVLVWVPLEADPHGKHLVCWSGTWSPNEGWGSKEMEWARGTHARCLRAVKVSSGSALPWRLAWRPGNRSSSLLVLIVKKFSSFTNSAFEGPVNLCNIRKGPAFEGWKKRGPHLRWALWGPGKSELLDCLPNLSSDQRWGHETGDLYYGTGFPTLIKPQEKNKTFSRSKKLFSDLTLWIWTSLGEITFTEILMCLVLQSRFLRRRLKGRDTVQAVDRGPLWNPHL